VQLIRRRTGVLATSSQSRVNYFSPATEIIIPEVLKDIVEKVTFSPPFVYFESALPPDPTYHHIDVPDQVAELLNANTQHALGYTGRGVHVVMIDSGFYNHQYYADKGYSITVETVGGDIAEDNEGHGTAIAANLFAVAPEIDFTMIKAISQDGDLNDVIAAFFKAIDMHFWENNRIDIITCSWGTCEGLMEYEDYAETRAVIETEIEVLVNQGVTIIFAAGNKMRYVNCFLGWPGTMFDVISVGGAYVHETLTDWEASSYASSGHSALYSSVTGPRKVPDVCGIVGQAPTGVLIALPTEPSSKADKSLAGGNFPNGDETASNDGWIVGSGTSSAAPMVAGVAALLIQKYRSEGVNFTPELIKFMLGSTARDITSGTSTCGRDASGGYDNATGHGLVNAEAAIAKKPPNCFIATAAYGSILAPEVNFLRSVRDVWIHNSPIGKSFLEGIEQLYYKFSPKVANAMIRNSRLRKLIRLSIVTPIVKALHFGVKVRHMFLSYQMHPP
jgi:subtilisin family serine protease